MADGKIIIRGSDVSFKLSLSANGFDPTKDTWKAEIIIGSKARCTIESSSAVMKNGDIYITAGTAGWPCGRIYIAVTALVPDDAFADGLRVEKCVADTGYSLADA